MGTVRVLFWVLCAAFIGGRGVFNSGIVGDGGSGVIGRAGRSAAAATVEAGNDGAERVVRAAQKEIGVQESGENAGERVDQYNAYVGLHKVAWCASFVSWCHGQAGYKEPRTGWSPALFPGKRLLNSPVQGSVLGIYYPHLGRIGHCGIVEGVKNDLVYSIEGNTNVSGSREGDGVYRKIRHRRTIARYADYIRGVK